MIIGVDAGMLGISDKRLEVGVWRVAVNLLTELGSLDKVNSYRLYSFAPIPEVRLKSFGSRMQNFILKPSLGWFSFRLPLELRLHPVDLFLGLGQAMPKTEAKKVGFIYDLGFLEYPEFYPGSLKKISTNTARLLERSKTIVCISDFVKNQILQKYHVDSEKLTTVYPGVSEVFSEKGTRYLNKRPYFLFVGSLKPQKNAALLISAYLEFLKETSFDVDLLFVGGDFWPDQEFQMALRNQKLVNRIKILGHVTDRELAELYRGALALVIPSRVEGFCIPATEAMHIGCPVIATRVGALPEIVGRAGILIDKGDARSLTAAMLKILNKEVRSKMIAYGITQSQKFSWVNFAKSVYNLYEK